MNLSFYKLIDNQFIAVTSGEGADLILLPFNEVAMFLKKVNWKSSILNEIEMAHKETKIDFFSDHYLCSLQIKNNHDIQREGSIIILEHKGSHLIVYEPKSKGADEYVAMINSVFSKMNAIHHAPALIPYTLIRYDIENDRCFLGSLEDKILDIELSIATDPNMVQGQVLELRKMLSLFKHHYASLLDLLEEIIDGHLDIFDKQIIHDYRRLSRKANRLYTNVLMLHEYVNQVNDSYRAQMEINLNKIMKIFTIISAIFMPLTLIVGWYGMNFKEMPELNLSYGYLYVIGLSLFVLASCLFYIKKKGFWD